MKAILERTYVGTPLGKMSIITSSRGLCGLEFIEPRRLEMLSARLAHGYPGSEVHDGANAELKAAARWVERYFAGDFQALDAIARDLPLDLLGTSFEKAVWGALLDISVGQLSTYGGLAKALSRPAGAARAVGMAVGRNPISILVPCQRIVGASGAITGYGGGLDRKEWLLRHEGCSLRGRSGDRRLTVTPP